MRLPSQVRRSDGLVLWRTADVFCRKNFREMNRHTGKKDEAPGPGSLRRVTKQHRLDERSSNTWRIDMVASRYLQMFAS
jgi:hypothetical protein